MFLALIAIFPIIMTWAVPIYRVSSYEWKNTGLQFTGGYTNTFRYQEYNFDETMKQCGKVGSTEFCNYDHPYKKTYTYGDGKCTNCKKYNNIGNVLGAFMALNLLSLILIILVIIISPISMTITKVSPKIPAILAILAVLFCIIGPISVMLALPNAFNADCRDQTGRIECLEDNGPCNTFQGHVESTDKPDSLPSQVKEYRYEAKWGPEAGWWLPFVSMVFILAAAIVLEKSPKAQPQQMFMQQVGQAPVMQTGEDTTQQQPQQYQQGLQDQSKGLQHPIYGGQNNTMCANCGAYYNEANCPVCGHPRI